MHSIKRDSNCLIVYKDEAERIIQEEMLQCFKGMHIWPSYILCDSLNGEGINLSQTEIHTLLSRNPDDRSVWVKNDTGEFVMAGSAVSAVRNDILLELYQTEVIKRLTALTSMLQFIGVKSYEVQVNEEINETDTRDNNFSVHGELNVAAPIASGDYKKTSHFSRNFIQKINGGFKFMQASYRPVAQINMSEIKRRLESDGLSGVHIFNTLLQAISDGERSWNSLEVEEMISSDINSSITHKLDTATQIAVKMYTLNISGEAARNSNYEWTKKIIQSLKIWISNR